MRSLTLRQLTAALLIVLFVAPAGLAQTPAKTETKKQNGKAPKKEAERQLTVSKPATSADHNAVDWETIGRIRNEAFRNSKVMQTLSSIADQFGSRLTNSPGQKAAAEWVKNELIKMGVENVHMEPWGPFGRGWSYDSAVVQVTAPYKATLIAAPKAWTPGTNGTVHGKVVRANIRTREDMDKFRGKLAGTIVMLGEMREVKPKSDPVFERYTEQQLADISNYKIPAARPDTASNERARRNQLARDIANFLVQEKVLATIEGGRAPGDGGTIFVQGQGQSFRKGEPEGVPALVLTIEHFGRIWRTLDMKKDVELDINVVAQFHDNNGDDFSYNVIGEIPGTDLKDEIVMLGAHLDSWHAATGSTDNAAGCAAMLEVMRIIKELGLKPRRTIRVAFWTGEEQGLMGSRGYVMEHFASRKENDDPQYKDLPPFLRPAKYPLEVKPAHQRLSAYYNIDSGTGKIRGISTQENGALVPIFKEWMEPFRDLGMTTVYMQNAGGSDFLSFDAVGLNGIDFLQDDIEYVPKTWHSNMDTFERIQRDDMLQMSAIVAGFVWQTAQRDHLLPRKPMPKDPKPPATTTDKPSQ